MPFGGVTVKDVDPHEFVRQLAEWLKLSGKIKLPLYVDFVKTGPHKELSPYDKDWYYIRAASIARHIYLRKGVGIGALAKVYGGKQRRGARPGVYRKANTAILRHVVQSLEKMRILDKDSNGGRKITSEGQKHLDRIAGQVLSNKK
ncbi:PREDICTED: 40S ribosomal protein S19-like [Amphimedon queenslandica]|uniref:40S ribosomal protein S19 n=2 Tax=Amphimedon queenslandica TaxID=400682 RepID=A0A1X7UHX7_AMPQE|nr:PREDICTED: 40S ribosomal protein S19-like [Amphimedon queenslandica]|eukprot:XP_003387776.1 PREDICTED: 40S ribosomal protein S19-like [Amphimedon queenslandica]